MQESYFRKELNEQDRYRYYKKINGYISDDYIDIEYINGEIGSIEDHRNSYDKILEINDKYLKRGTIENYIAANGSKYNFVRIKDSHIVYCNMNKMMTPVRIDLIEYSNGKYTILYEDCTNLTTGEKIDYSNIIKK